MTLEAFLESIEGRAYRMAYAACGHREDALDMVQDAMFKFVDKYAKRPSDEWRPLFYRILHNRITDSYRRRSVRERWNGFIGKPPSLDEGTEVDPFQTAPDMDAPTPEHSAKVGDAFQALQAAVQKLPERQRQVFLLRGWEELSVKETAFALKCSEGSVKTHFSRAVNTLREQLGDHWP
ncbi:RNA polymerase sigma factor [Oceanidesulfovibrio marinus]|uniref:RNA polymerase sigma factor n=1 Tax=Oceanidesulfovibrio marinus TaxID=370038 RepID=A0ABX6NEJ9_9BACT|nr:RNA polymerase sigma factor [Oceanidesulfovibrio marinus]QJT09013.1 RNA polymerase sigma factor [Oceanidesulfovibrio marinus]